MLHDEEPKIFLHLTKKEIIAIAALLVLIGIGVGLWFWYRAILSEGEREIEGQQEALETDQTKIVEEKISQVKEQLEELTKLSPEERAKKEKEREILTAEKVIEDVKISGINIIVLEDKKNVKNFAQNYSIIVPLNLVVARSIASNLIEFHDKQFFCPDPSCDPVFRIEVTEANLKELVIEKWFAVEERKAGAEIYSPREKLTIEAQAVWRVTEIVPRTEAHYYYYYWSRGTKVYSLRVSEFNDEKYQKYIGTFKLE